jgi:hypothetical protein
VTGVHFLGHIVGAIRDTARDLSRSSGDPARRHRATRLLLVAGALAVGLLIAAVFTPNAAVWNLPHHG